MSLELALRGAIYRALAADDDVAAFVGARIFDLVPDGAARPYVELGEVQVLDGDVGCGQWLETFIDVHVWSETMGMPQAMRIMSAVRSALHSADLDFDNEGDPVGAVQSFQHQSSRVMRGRDPKVTHGIITFRALLAGEY